MRHATIRRERPGSWAELALRRVYSGIVYWRVYRKLHPDRPHYAPGAIARIEALLDRNSAVFEWGSGISTLWYAPRVGSLVTIEHDDGWYHKVSGWIEEAGSASVSLRHVPDEEGTFGAYSRAILEYPDHSFDLIAIDGRARVECARHALRKLKPEGTLVLDDSYRLRYRPVFDLLAGASAQKYDCGLLQTTVFERPAPARDAAQV